MRGYTFSFTISANTQRNRGTAEYDFIDSEECNKLYDAYSQTEHDEDRISVKMFYQSMNDATEELVWAAPIKSATLTYRIDSRREITYLEMYEKLGYFLHLPAQRLVLCYTFINYKDGRKE